MAALVSKMPVAVDSSTMGTTTDVGPSAAWTRMHAPQACAFRKFAPSTPAARVGTALGGMLQAVIPGGFSKRAGTFSACQGALQAAPAVLPPLPPAFPGLPPEPA